MSEENKLEFYFGGFRETNTKRDPGFRFEHYCSQIGKQVERLILPGDLQNGSDGIFSMDASKEAIKDALLNINSLVRITVHSLMAWPTIEAIQEILQEKEELKNYIDSVTFLNPAKTPLKSVQRLDWVLRGGVGEVFDELHFLEGDPDEVFKLLITGWKGNGPLFQENLRRKIGRKEFDRLVSKLFDQFGIKFVEYANNEDVITNENRPLPDGDRAAATAMLSHLPKLTGKEIYDLAA